MNSDSLPVYRHSGKFGIHGPLLALVVALVLGFPLGLAYAYIIKWCPLVYINFLATAGYGLLFGLIGGYFLKFGKVRNTAVAALTGILAGLIAWYFNWSGHVYALFKGAPLVSFPDMILRVMGALYDQGSWGMHRSGNITGIPLAIVWVVEAGIIIGLTAFTAVGFVSDVPFCERKQCWLDQEKKISTLRNFTDPAHLAALKVGDLAPLVRAQPKDADSSAFARLILKHSPRTQEFCTVRIENVTTTLDKNGNSKEQVEKLTSNLKVPPSTFELLAKFENFGVTPEPEGKDAPKG
jgi:hypothetical protein